MMFRNLNKTETKKFRKWARDNYKPNSEISELWHPVVRNECHAINSEFNQKEPNNECNPTN